MFFCDRHVRKNRVRLEHHIDRTIVRRLVGHIDAVDFDRAARRYFEAGQHAQQRRLAAARTAEDRKQFAFGNVEVDVIDGDEVAEVFADAVECG